MDIINKPLMTAPKIDHQKCSGCNRCVEICTNGVLEVIDINKDKQHRFFRLRRLKAMVKNQANCTNCGKCSAVCRHNAILFT